MRVKNWKRFQHFNDRRPPWIKLYRDLLDDKKWHDLDADSAKLLISLWLLASEDETKTGKLPLPDEIAFRLRITEKHLKSCICNLSHWLDQDDINAISDIKLISGGYHVETPERETEKETETEARDKRACIRPDDVRESVWNDFMQIRKAKKAPMTNTAITAIRKQAEIAGISLEAALSMSCARGWQGFKAEWAASDKPKDKKVAW